MGTYEAEQLLPGISLDYFLSAKQQLKVVLQWVGVKARGQAAYRIPESAGDLARDPASDANVIDFRCRKSVCRHDTGGNWRRYQICSWCTPDNPTWLRS